MTVQVPEKIFYNWDRYLCWQWQVNFEKSEQKVDFYQSVKSSPYEGTGFTGLSLANNNGNRK